MNFPILQTKINLPSSRDALVDRGHLIEKLDNHKHRKLILVSAPAGFGKTTLLSSWIHKQNIPAAWLSLDEEDNTPIRFLLYMVASLDRAGPGSGDSIINSLQSPKPPRLDSILPNIVEYISGFSGLVIVLDDYHVIHNIEIHTILQYLLKHLPQHIKLAVASRTDPPVALSLLRGRDQLTEIRAADLRFSDSEAASFISLSAGIDIANEDILLLNRRAEGWISGLQMAVASLRNQEDCSSFIHSFSGNNRYILDYLLEEVLNRQSGEIQSFMLKTSILPRFTPELCRCVTGADEASEILDMMDRTNLFLVPLDDKREWFRYHHLFSELLFHRLLIEMPEGPDELRRQASKWYEKNGCLEEAIGQALAAGAWDIAISQIGIYIETIWEYGVQESLSRWLPLIPEKILASNPEIVIYYAFSLCFAGRFEEAERELVRIEEMSSALPAGVIGKISTVRAYSALYRDRIEDAAEYSERALEGLSGNEHNWLTLAYSIYGDVHVYYGYIPAYEEIWRKAIGEAALSGNIFFRLYTAAKLSVAQRRLGRLKDSAETFCEETGRAFRNGYSVDAVPGALYSVYGEILLEWNRLEEGLDYIKQGQKLSKQQGYTAGTAWSMITEIQAYYNLNELEATEEAVVCLEEAVSTSSLPEWTRNWLYAWKVRLAVLKNDLVAAAEILKQREIGHESLIRYPAEVEYLAYSRYLLAKEACESEAGWGVQALSILNSLEAHLRKQAWKDKLLETYVLRVLTWIELGEKDAAAELLSEVLTLAEPGGYRRLFLNDGHKLAPVLYSLSFNHQKAGYIREILSLIPSPQEPGNPVGKGVLPEPLSSRELEVLRHLVTGASNKEVAADLFISAGTVKNHLKNIFGKLDVHNRTQAISRGRTLGLIE